MTFKGGGMTIVTLFQGRYLSSSHISVRGQGFSPLPSLPTELGFLVFVNKTDLTPQYSHPFSNEIVLYVVKVTIV